MLLSRWNISLNSRAQKFYHENSQELNIWENLPRVMQRTGMRDGHFARQRNKYIPYDGISPTQLILIITECLACTYYYYIRGLEQSLVGAKTLQKTVGNGDPMHEVWILYMISYIIALFLEPMSWMKLYKNNWVTLQKMNENNTFTWQFMNNLKLFLLRKLCRMINATHYIRQLTQQSLRSYIYCN